MAKEVVPKSYSYTYTSQKIIYVFFLLLIFMFWIKNFSTVLLYNLSKQFSGEECLFDAVQLL